MLGRLFLFVAAASVVPAIFASSDMIFEDYEVSPVRSSFSSSSSSKKIIPRDHERGEYPRVLIERVARRRTEYFNDIKSEAEKVNAFFDLMSLIEAVCKEGLKREDKREFVAMWLSAIYTLAEEAIEENALTGRYSDLEKDSNGPSEDEMFLKRTIAFGRQSKDLASDSDSSASTDYDAKDTDFFSKSKMIKGDDFIESEDEKEGKEGREELTATSVFVNRRTMNPGSTDYGDFVEYAEFTEEKADYSTSSECEEQTVIVKTPAVKRRGRARGPGGLSNTLSAAANALTTEIDDGMVSEELAGLYAPNSEEADGTTEIDLSRVVGGTLTADPNAIRNDLMEKLQEQLLAQLMSQIQERTGISVGLNGLDGQVPTPLQLESVLGADICALPEMNRESLIDFLRTSALPKLLNSAVKGKTGVDVLKSLAMGLRVVNESLGVAEVVLKMMIKTTRTVRYYVLFSSQVVADMAREDNLKPIVDLSVSMDSIPVPKKQSSISKGMTKMFRRGLKSSKEQATGGDSSDASPFTLAMQAALSRARDYKSEFQKLPPTLLLRVIHTVFAELEKRNGIIRVALARKRHKTLIGLQDSINGAVERIYEAINVHEPSSSDHLQVLQPIIFTDILISLISPVKMEPADLEAHISQVTQWIKPLMAILDQEAQLGMINFLLNDPEVEGQQKNLGVKRFSWSIAKKRK